MQRRLIGSTNLEVSVLALGTRSMAGEAEGWGQADDNEAIATIERAIDLGINLIQTAPGYGEGRSEEIVGKAIREHRGDVLIATLCGLVPPRAPGQPSTHRLTPDSILRECESSLRRLRTDYIDLYQCSWSDPDTPMSETLAAMQLLMDQGKVRAVGLSEYGCEEVAAALQCGQVHAVQTPFSLLRRRAAEDLLPFCAGHGLGALVCSPLAKGLLTGKFSAESRLRGLRGTDTEFLGPRFQRNLERVAQLSAIAARYRKTVTQLALQWVIRHPGVTSAIVGAKRPSQIEENAGGEGWELEVQDLEAIENLFAGG